MIRDGLNGQRIVLELIRTLMTFSLKLISFNWLECCFREINLVLGVEWIEKANLKIGKSVRRLCSVLFLWGLFLSPFQNHKVLEMENIYFAFPVEFFVHSRSWENIYAYYLVDIYSFIFLLASMTLQFPEFPPTSLSLSPIQLSLLASPLLDLYILKYPRIYSGPSSLPSEYFPPIIHLSYDFKYYLHDDDF